MQPLSSLLPFAIVGKLAICTQDGAVLVMEPLPRLLACIARFSRMKMLSHKDGGGAGSNTQAYDEPQSALQVGCLPLQ